MKTLQAPLFVSLVFASACSSMPSQRAPSSAKDECEFVRAALRALPAEGGEVYVPAGTYNCAAPIVIDRSNVFFHGASQDKVIFRLADQVHAPLLIIGDRVTKMNGSGQYVTSHRVSNIRVSDMTFDGNRQNHDPKKECGEGSCDGDPNAVRNNGITIRGANDIVVKNVTAHSTISGGMVTEKFCYRLNVRNFNSYDNYFDGFAGYETEDSNFSQLELHHNRGAGISIDIHFNNNVVRDSVLHDNGDVGIFARDLHGNTFRNLGILRSGNHGVFLAKSSEEDPSSCASDNTFESVNISDSARTGFRLNNGCPGNHITGQSSLCDNAEGPYSEDAAGTLAIDKGVRCR